MVVIGGYAATRPLSTPSIAAMQRSAHETETYVMNSFQRYSEHQQIRGEGRREDRTRNEEAHDEAPMAADDAGIVRNEALIVPVEEPEGLEE